MAKKNIDLSVILHDDKQPIDDFKMLLSIPWDHHRRIIDKCKDDMDIALFFVRKTWENNWGHDALLNWLYFVALILINNLTLYNNNSSDKLLI